MQGKEISEKDKTWIDENEKFTTNNFEQKIMPLQKQLTETERSIMEIERENNEQKLLYQLQEQIFQSFELNCLFNLQDLVTSKHFFNEQG